MNEYFKRVYLGANCDFYRTTYFFSDSPEENLGHWKATIFGGREMVLPSSEAEYEMAERQKFCFWDLMRREERCSYSGFDERPACTIEYRPNRHQRKQDLDTILAIARKLSDGYPVSCSDINW